MICIISYWFVYYSSMLFKNFIRQCACVPMYTIYITTVYAFGGVGQAMALNVRELYMEIPLITRAYTTACVVTTLGVVST